MVNFKKAEKRFKYFRFRAGVGLFCLLIIAGLGIFGSKVLAQTWSEPSASPPNNNIAPPIWNQNTAAQTGSFWLSGGGIFGGSVGIGTTTPTYKLEVKSGTAGFAFDAINQRWGTLFGTGGGLELYGEAPGSATGGSIFMSGSARGDDGRSAIRFSSNGVERMRIDGDYSGHTIGNIGIGNTNPAYKLDITGTLNASGDITQNGVKVCLADGTNCTGGSGSTSSTWGDWEFGDDLPSGPYTNDGDDRWTSVSYGNGVYVAVGTDNATIGTKRYKIATSIGGVSWTMRTVSGDSNQYSGLYSIAFGNSTFVAVGDQVNSTSAFLALTSSDGVNWTKRTSGSWNNQFWRGVTYGNGLFVTVGKGNAAYPTAEQVMTSPDGVTWTSRAPANTNIWSSVAYGNGTFVAVAQDQGSSANQVMTSPDGITWTARSSPVAGWISVAYGNGLFVAVSAGTQIMTSPNGITWTSRTSATAASGYNVTYGNGKFVIVAAYNAPAIIESTDGITWRIATSPDNPNSGQVYWMSVVAGQDEFVTVSYAAHSAHSYNGTNPSGGSGSGSAPISIIYSGTSSCPAGYTAGRPTDGKAYWSSPSGSFIHDGNSYTLATDGTWTTAGTGTAGRVCLSNSAPIVYSNTSSCSTGYTAGRSVDGKAYWSSPSGSFIHDGYIYTLATSGAWTTSSYSASNIGRVCLFASGSGGSISGSGTLNYLPKFTPDGATLGDSQVADDGTNVGIGTSAPASKLHVYTTTIADGMSIDGPNAPALNIKNAGVAKVFLGLATSVGQYVTGSLANDLILRTEDTTNGNMFFVRGTTMIMKLATNGYVGIGTTVPNSLLDVAASDATTYTATTVPNPAIRITNPNATVNNGASLRFSTGDTAGSIVGTSFISAVFTSHTVGSTAGDLVFQMRNAGVVGEVMRLTSIGRLGIGTATPSYLLDVNGEVNGTSLCIAGNCKTSWPAAGGTNYWTASGNNIYSNNTGNVGIGTTSPGSKLSIVEGAGAPGKSFELYFGSGANRPLTMGVSRSNGDAWMGWNAYQGTGDTQTYAVSNYAAMIKSSDGLIFLVAPSGTAGNTISWTNAMSILSNGNVGIGTSSPGAKLETVSGTSTQYAVGQQIVQRLGRPNIDGLVWPEIVDFTIGRYSAGVATAPKTRFDINLKNADSAAQLADVTVMTMQSDGNVGIGTTTPNEKLVVGSDLGALTANTAIVVGDTAADSAIYVGQGGGGVGSIKWVYNGTVVNAAMQIVTAGYSNPVKIDGSSVLLQSGSSGNVGIGTATPGTKGEVYRLETGVRTSYSDILTISAAANTLPYGGHGGGILFRATNYLSGAGNATTLVNSARIGSTITDNSVTHTGASLFFDTTPLEDGVLARAMTILYNGNVGIGTAVPTSKLQVIGLPVYANNAAAITGGLSAGAFYRTGADPDIVCVVH